jgi:hypothetical protein
MRASERFLWDTNMYHALSIFLAISVSQPAHSDGEVFSRAPKEIPADVRAAWEKAGATAGWLVPMEGPTEGHLRFVTRLGKHQAGCPAFHWRRWDPTVLAGLPVPHQPFGLDLSYVGLATEDCAHLAKLKTLVALDATRSGIITVEGIRTLSGMKNLKALDLGYSQVSDESLKELATMSQLELLSLRGDRITDANAEAIVRLTNLRHLNVGFTNTSDKFAAALAQMTKLEYLDVSTTKITDAGLAGLTQMRKLEYLDVSATKITDAGLAGLAACTSLNGLDLFGTRVSGQGLERNLPRTSCGNSTSNTLTSPTRT